jgi:hypothetical protein
MTAAAPGFRLFAATVFLAACGQNAAAPPERSPTAAAAEAAGCLPTEVEVRSQLTCTYGPAFLWGAWVGSCNVAQDERCTLWCTLRNGWKLTSVTVEDERLRYLEDCDAERQSNDNISYRPTTVELGVIEDGCIGLRQVDLDNDCKNYLGDPGWICEHQYLDLSQGSSQRVFVRVRACQQVVL